MTYRLNQKSLERLKALIRAGKYVDRAWTFTPAESNALLGDPPNWTEYQQWFLGVGMGVPDAPNSPTDPNPPRKEDYAYPFGRGDVVNLAALRSIAKSAEPDIADAATAALASATEQIADSMTAGAAVPRRAISWTTTATLRAAVAGKVPTFDADAYTGGAMQLEGWTHPVVIDYDGMDVTNKSRPVLRDHDPKRPIGHTDSLGVEAGIFKARGPLSVESDDKDEVVNAAKNNFPWQISVGADVIKNQFVPEGSTAQANGKTWSGPINISRQTRLREISFLTLGADDDTSARIAAHTAGVNVMKKKFAAWAKAAGFKLKEMSDEDTKAAKSAFKAAMKCEADDPKDEDDDGKDDAQAGAKPLQIQAAASATTAANAADETVKAIRAAATQEGQRITTITAKLEEYRSAVEPAKFAEIQAKAIGGEISLDQTELALIKAKRPTLNAPNINVGAGSRPDGAIIAAAAARSCGVSEKAAFAGLNEQSGNIAASMRGMSLHQIIAYSAAAMGIHCSAGGITDDFLGDFLPRDKATHRQQMDQARSSGTIRASSSTGFATMSLSGITENIMNKVMLEQFNLQASVVSDIAYERDTNDLRPFKVYRLTASGDLEPVGDTGEVKTMSLQDASYSNQVITKAAVMPIGRAPILNDDMGALTQAPQIAGRKGALNRERTALATFLSGLTAVAPGSSIGKPANSYNFWSTGAKNYQSGAGSALSIAGLSSAVTLFRQQTDDNNDPIMLSPDRLLLCPELEATGKNLFSGASIVVNALASTSAKGTEPNFNTWAGNFKPLTTPYLGGGSPLTGKSATQWALLCNPAGGSAVIQAGYLRGQRTPIIRQVDTDANMLGLAYQIIYDIGFALLDSRCGVYSAGV